MSLVAIPIFDLTNNAIPSGSITQLGASVNDPYRVNTSERDAALSALGLPPIGSEHPNHAGSYCTALEWQYMGGGGSASNDGWSLVVAVFEPLARALFDLVYEDGDSYSETVFSDGSFGSRFDVAGNPIPETQVEGFRSELIVHRYATSPAILVSFLSKANKVNSNAFTAPPLFGVGGPISIAARELLVRSPQIQLARPGLLRLSLRFGYGLADWHRLAYRKEDSSGAPTGPVLHADLYEEAAFPVASWWSA